MEKEILELTYDQQKLLCWIIDEWYLDWKGKITKPDTGHRLGIAKEQLKMIMCGERSSNEIEVINKEEG